MDSDTNQNTEDKLEQVVAFLRTTDPPPVPEELLPGGAECSPRASSDEQSTSRKLRRRMLTATVTALVATALIVFAVWLTWRQLPTPGGEEIVEEEKPAPVVVATTVTPLQELEPYTDLEDKVDTMLAEIETLRQQAKLLDAYRRANELLAYDTESR